MKLNQVAYKHRQNGTHKKTKDRNLDREDRRTPQGRKDRKLQRIQKRTPPSKLRATPGDPKTKQKSINQQTHRK